MTECGTLLDCIPWQRFSSFPFRDVQFFIRGRAARRRHEPERREGGGRGRTGWGGVRRHGPLSPAQAPWHRRFIALKNLEWPSFFFVEFRFNSIRSLVPENEWDERLTMCNAFFESGEQWPHSFFIKLTFMHVYAVKFTLLHLPFSIASSNARKIWASAMHIICLLSRVMQFSSNYRYIW